MRTRAIVFLTCLVVWVHAAHAQAGPPRFEIGGSGGAFVGGGDGGWFLVFTLGPRLTVNVTPRDAVEILAEVVGPVESTGLNGLYLIQYKRLLSPRAARRSHLSLLASVGGSFQYYRERESREERPDGSVFVVPAYTHSSVDGPMFGAVGVGFERVLARYIATRSDLQLTVFRFGGVGLRGTFGVSIPIGGYRDR
jgi:hypothetical protein